MYYVWRNLFLPSHTPGSNILKNGPAEKIVSLKEDVVLKYTGEFRILKRIWMDMLSKEVMENIQEKLYEKNHGHN